MSKKILFVFWVVFAVSHLINIMQFPIFEDEAEYLLLAVQIFNNPLHNFFIYFYSGLLPMYGWLTSSIMILTKDSLLSGRLLNVLLASSLIFWIEEYRKTFSLSKKFSIIATILLISSSNILLNSRISLLDTSILVFTAWYIIFAAKILERPYKSWYVIGFNICLILAFLTKATAVFGIPAVIFLSILHYKRVRKIDIKLVIIILSLFLIICLSGVVTLFYGNQIGYDTGSSFISFLRVDQIIYKIKENIFLTWIWLQDYYFVYIAFAMAITLTLFLNIKQTIIKFNQGTWLMIVWAVTSLILMILFNRFYYPRHILNVSLPLIVVASTVLMQLPVRIAAIATIFIVIFESIFNFNLLFNFYNVKYTREDRFSYFEDYTAGTRIKDVALYIKSLQQGKTITVWLDGSYVLEYGLRREFIGNTNIEFKSTRFGRQFVSHYIGSVSKGKGATYVVVNRHEPKNINKLKLIKNFKVSFRHGIDIYELK